MPAYVPAAYDYSSVDWDAIRRLARWYSGDIHDILDRHDAYGYLAGISLYGALEAGQVVCGPAATILYETSARKGRPQDVYHAMIDRVVKGGILLVDSSCAEGSGSGELMSTGAKMAGAVATIVNGTVRDLAEVRKLGYPLFAKGVSPVGVSGRMEATKAQVPLKIGGVRVAPGDVLLADINGVVAIPQKLVPAIAEAADKLGEAEARARGRILEGERLQEIWPV